MSLAAFVLLALVAAVALSQCRVLVAAVDQVARPMLIGG